jgi:carboxypeptidase C (cathepsin A)
MLDSRIFKTFAIICLMAIATSSAAQTPADKQAAATSEGEKAVHAARDEKAQGERSAPRLPGDVSTEHTIDLPGRTLRFTATAGSIPLKNGEGKVQAEVAYIAYVASGGDAARPVTFAFNGGPGSASAYLHLGAMGPWRLPLDGLTPSTSPVLTPNGDTWLDFTDLVFIDPVGTGYSRLIANKDDVKKQFWSIDGDAESLAVFIRKWIEKNGRQASPKLIAGESYGGFRAPKIVRKLQGSQGVGISGVMLISPVLEFGWREHRESPLGWVTRLPSMAAANIESEKAFNRDDLREVERYAATDYLVDLVRGTRDTAAVERISAKVATFTGLDPALVRKLAGRVDNATFVREYYRNKGLVGSSYDATITGYDPDPTSARGWQDDPFTRAINAPLSSAMTDLYRRVLKWNVEEPYRLSNGDVTSHWDWGRGRTSPSAVDDLRSIIASDAKMRVMVAHGASDLVTPYFGNQLLIEQLPTFGAPERLALSLYGGGHMFYSRDASRRMFRNDVEQMYRSLISNQQNVPRN